MGSAGRVFASTLVLLLILCAGCAGPSSGPKAPVDLTAADDGSTTQLAVGQQMRITLESNQTTGYRWAIDGDVPPQLKQVGEPAYTAEPGALGAGGTEAWTFEATRAGEGALKLKYWRSFEPTAAPAATFEVGVVVK